VADRVVKVTIQASIANYVSGMEKVRKATADAANESEKLEKFGEAATSVGTALVGIGAVAVGASAVIVKMAADFDAQMSKVQAATNATASEMDKFRNQALTAGAAFGYTATQVTEAQVELGKAGLATKDILGGGLTGVLALAASDNVDLGKATQIAAVAMKQFNLAGSDVPHIADLLAAGAGKALGGVQELGDALNQSGLVASNFGFSIEETTGVLSSFADAGLLGSDAGTSLKSMLQMLANPSKESAQLMKSLGINVEDANGQFLGAADIAQVLNDRLSTLSDAQRQQALSQIFGADAVRAATVLYKEGADGIQQYIDQNNDAGYAMEQAAKKSDNLNGDLKKLQSAFQSGLIETGTAANGALRPLVQTMTQVVTAFNGLPEPVKGSALALTAVVGGATLLAGGLLIAIPKIVAFRAALATLAAGGITGRAALGTVASFLGGPWGAALALGALAVTAFVAPQLEAAKRTKEFVGTLDSVTGAVTKTTSALVASNLATKGTFLGIEVGPSTFDQAKQAGLSLQTIQKAAEGNTKAYKELKQSVAELDDARGVGNISENKAASAGDRVLESVEKQREALAAAKDQTTQMAQAQDASADASEDAASGMDSLAASAEEATQSISDTADAIKGFNSVQLDVNSAQRDLEASIDAVTESVKENGQSLDVTTEKGRANAASLDSIAQSTLNYAGALYQQTGSQEQATGALESGRASLISALGQYGITGQAAEDYANKILGTPKDWATLFQTETQQAAADVDSLKKKIKDVPSSKRTKLEGDLTDAQSKLASLRKQLGDVPSSKTTKLQAEIAAAEQNIQRIKSALAGVQSKTVRITTEEVRVGNAMTGTRATKATGGPIYGPGTATSDSIPAMLSNGEYVVKASSVDKYGVAFLDRVNAGMFAAGGIVERFASGGQARLSRKAPAPKKPAYTYNAGGNFQFTLNRRAGQYDGMSGVSELISMFGNSQLPSSLRNQSVRAALKYQLSMKNLSDRSDDAARKLSDLRQSADSLKSSVASAVGKVDVGDYRSASSLRRGLSKTAGNVTEFANLLSALAKKGINGDLLAEIASLGTAEGLPLARSLAKASSADIKSINSSYSSIQSTATKAGQTVADANYKAQIAAADKNARSLESQIAKQSRAIQGIIARGFGLKGYAAGGYTGELGVSQVAGVVHGREFVVNAAATARNRGLLEAMNQGGNVRYMDRSPVVAAAPVSAPVRGGDRHYHLTTLDPEPFVQAVERRERSEYV